LWCNISGPGHDHVKYEEDAAGPKMAKHLEDTLRANE
jgi:hypothetical protein